MAQIIKRNIKIMDDFITAFKGCKTILDLGTARAGKLDKICQAIGAIGEGWDIDPNMVNSARKNSRISIHQGDMCEVIKEKKTGSFDGVLMLDTMEHCSKRDIGSLLENAVRVARIVVVGTMPLEEVPRNHPGEFMQHQSSWNLDQVEALWGPKAFILHDPTFHLRLSSKKGSAYVEDLKKNTYHGQFPEWTLCVFRHDHNYKRFF